MHCNQFLLRSSFELLGQIMVTGEAGKKALTKNVAVKAKAETAAKARLKEFVIVTFPFRFEPEDDPAGCPILCNSRAKPENGNISISCLETRCEHVFVRTKIW